MFQFGRHHKKDNPYHPDLFIWLIGIPFISAFNYYLTYSSIKWGWFLLLTYSIDTTQGYLAIFLIRAHILFLDKTLPYEKGIFRRVVVQFLTTSFLGLFIISFTTELASLIAKGKFAPFDFYSFDLFIISIWFFVINGIYVMLYFISKWGVYQQQFRPDQDGLLLKIGAKNIRLSFNQILAIQADKDYSVILDDLGKKFYHDISLNALEQIMPSQFFFRINRQAILHRRVIEGFERIENGKLKVLLTRALLSTPPIVSRDKSSSFRKWFETDDTIQG